MHERVPQFFIELVILAVGAGALVMLIREFLRGKQRKFTRSVEVNGMASDEFLEKFARATEENNRKAREERAREKVEGEQKAREEWRVVLAGKAMERLISNDEYMKRLLEKTLLPKDYPAPLAVRMADALLLELREEVNKNG